MSNFHQYLLKNPAVQTAARPRLLLALGLLLASGCTGGEQKVQHAGPGRVHDKIIGASLAPPPGWEPAPNQGGNRLIFVGPVHAKYRANMNVLSAPDSGASLEQLAPQLQDQLARAMPEWKKFDEGFTTLGGRQACWVSGDFLYSGNQLRTLQYTLKGSRGKTFTLTFNAPRDEFPELLESLQRCANSLLVD